MTYPTYYGAVGGNGALQSGVSLAVTPAQILKIMLEAEEELDDISET